MAAKQRSDQEACKFRAEYQIRKLVPATEGGREKQPFAASGACKYRQQHELAKSYP
jgi:hypothetical protein